MFIKLSFSKILIGSFWLFGVVGILTSIVGGQDQDPFGTPPKRTGVPDESKPVLIGDAVFGKPPIDPEPADFSPKKSDKKADVEPMRQPLLPTRKPLSKPEPKNTDNTFDTKKGSINDNSSLKSGSFELQPKSGSNGSGSKFGNDQEFKIERRINRSKPTVGPPIRQPDLGSDVTDDRSSSIKQVLPNTRINPKTGMEYESNESEDLIRAANPLPFKKWPFDEKMWAYLKVNNYRNWAPVPGSTGGLQPGNGPHGAYQKVYLNRTAISRPYELPVGSVMVKENFDRDQNLTAITVMYRVENYNLSSGNWYWLKYDRNGRIERTASVSGSSKLSGRVKSCIDCHAGAGNSDFVFFNDN